MYYNPYHYPAAPYLQPSPAYMMGGHLPRTYPPVNTEIFSKSIKSFKLLIDQGAILLDRLGNLNFSKKLMNAAQQGKQAEVDHLIKSLGLKVPVKTTYSPSGVKFELSTNSDPGTNISCCTLNINMKWGH
ncbi:hypothetical protein [Neobacillus mesonae]|uniref:hypothetical protein n=1 Tax=Neobacillus mesonae TaxID=1193713 RepID=UPI00203D081E|nr:hypothetical protein [Neobacillus mesonae]MCM3569731.1 hypothetical protein [Neobacillus mesonae]